MSQHEYDEATELSEQLIRMSCMFAERYPGAEVEHVSGLVVTLSGTNVPFLNAIHLSSPVCDREDLAGRCRVAIERGARRRVPWFFSACDAWMGESEAARGTLAGLGLRCVSRSLGMVADELAPARTPPGELEICRVEDERTRHALADLNMLAHGMPIAMGREGPGQRGFWSDSFFGHVGFVRGEPVSCALTVPVDGRLHVSWVATHPERRRRGYGEAVMRYSLEEARAATGLRRTVLHATESGRPLYEAMGYRPSVRFSRYQSG